MSAFRLNEPDFEKVLSSFSPDVQALTRAARKLLLDVLPETFEVVWTQQKIAGYGTGPKKMTEHFVWLAPQKAYLTFGFYYGAELDDSAKLLEGTGAKMRHVKVRSMDDLKTPALRKLVEQSIRHRVPPPLPFGAATESTPAKKATSLSTPKAGKTAAKKKPASAAKRPASKKNATTKR